jgi:uncharacterized membrane protein
MEFTGRLHPLLVHLPIGILLLAFGLECYARWRRRQDLKPAIDLALAAGALSAVATAVTGWLLSQQGGYEETLLQRHQWLGFGTAALALLVWLGKAQRWYFPVFAVMVAALIAAGHFGGSLTHGANYLFEQKNDETTAETGVFPTADPEMPVFAAYIQPVLEKKCASCHNASKHKGDLRLDTPEWIQKGGKNGAVIDLQQPAESPLLQRIHLPLHHDDHMPPAGKPQLTDLETRLFEWWIGEGADFEKKVKESPLPEDLLAALQKAQAGRQQNPVFRKSIGEASAADLQRLKTLFVSVSKLDAAAPWLAVSFAGLQHPAPAHWDALRGVADQTVDLDLAHTDAGDAVLAGFEHLIRLNLAHSAITDGVAKPLQGMQYLESLNLTGTAVSDAVLESLAQLPHLKHLYLWQTAVSPGAISTLQQQRPELRIETGAVVADTTRLALRAPKLLYGRTFFDDTVHVTLDFPAFKGVSLYYTLDEAASPTAQSDRYREPLVLSQTAHLRTFAAKEGWLNSPLVDMLFVKKRYTPKEAQIAGLPSPKYPAKGASSLIDGEIAGEQGADTWLGYEGEHLTATLDLGKTETLNRVFVHCLENNVAWIFAPAAIQVQTSMDGKTFRPQGSRQFPANAAMGESKAHLLSCDFPKPVEARYVRVFVKSLLKNPAWHPSGGQKCWIFVDEVLVE